MFKHAMARTLWSRCAAILGAIAIVFAAASVTVGTAHADVNGLVAGDYTAGAVNIRTCPWTSCASKGMGYPGQGVTIECWKHGQAIGPNNNTIWFRHWNNTTGVYGYSSQVYINFFAPVDLCTN